MSIIKSISGHRPVRRALIPRAIFASLLTAAALCGCVRYDMTLTNGGAVTNVRKPILDKQGASWIYISHDGKTNSISASRVVKIVPHGEKD